MLKAVVFDLDGTLLDTLPDIAASANRVLEGLGYPSHELNDYRYFVGAGINQLISRALPPEHRDNQDLLKKVLALMVEEYHRSWRDNSRPYPQIEKLLAALADKGVAVSILSNKPHPFTVEMVNELLPGYKFSAVLGASPDTPHKPDPKGLLKLAGIMGVNAAELCMVGDSGIDMQTAKNGGCFAVGVLWGLRSAEELKAQGADALITEPLQLLDYLQTSSSS